MADVDVHYGPVTITADPVTVNVQGLDDNQTTLTLKTPEPLTSSTKLELAVPQPIRTELAIPQPIRTESTTALDLQPVALDQCLNIRLGSLPPTCIRQPYQLHLGITLFGVEIAGFNLAGESQAIVVDQTRRPHTLPDVEWAGERSAVHEPHQPEIVHTDSAGALRIRLGK
jgi:hypothetical protein